jgi:hypothetical protein
LTPRSSSRLRGDEAATRYLPDIPNGQRAASILARIEIEGGLRSGERRSVAGLFSILTLLPVTDGLRAAY